MCAHTCPLFLPHWATDSHRKWSRIYGAPNGEPQVDCAVTEILQVLKLLRLFVMGGTLNGSSSVSALSPRLNEVLLCLHCSVTGNSSKPCTFHYHNHCGQQQWVCHRESLKNGLITKPLAVEPETAGKLRLN